MWWLKFVKQDEASADGAAAGGGGAAAAPATPSAPAADAGSSSELTFDDIETALRFDGLSQPPEPAKPDAGQQSQTQEAQGQPQGQQQQQGQQPQTQQQTQSNPEMELLKQQLTEAQKIIQAFTRQQPQPGQQQGQGQGQGQQPGQQPGQQAEPEVPPYEFNIPDGLVALLDSEVPAERQKGIGALMQGTARAVHATVMQQVAKQVQELTQNLPQVVNQGIQQHNYAREIFSDFYNTHKHLNRPELRSLVVQTAQAVMQETGAQAWSPQLRDAIAQRVTAVLTQVVPPAPPQQQQPFVAGNGSRPGGAPMGGNTQADDIFKTLF